MVRNGMSAHGDRECNNPLCESFAHEPMFTHDAIWDIQCPVALNERTFDLCQYSYHELAYLHGLDAPNYPVPAVYKQGLDPDYQGTEIVWTNILFRKY